MQPAFSWSLLSQCSHISTWLLRRLYVLLTTSNPVASLVHHYQHHHHPIMTTVTIAIITIDTIIIIIPAWVNCCQLDTNLSYLRKANLKLRNCLPQIALVHVYAVSFKLLMDV